MSIHNPAQQQFQQTFISVPGKSSQEIIINDFYKDTNDNLWIGTTEGIFFRRAGESTFEYKPVMYKGNKLNVSKFFHDENGLFYLGTNYSLFVYDAGKKQYRLLPNTEKDSVMNKIIASRVVSIIKDSIEGKPILLVSPYGHFLAYYDLTEKKWVSRLDTVQNIIRNFNIKDNLIRKIYKASSGKIWLATVKEGLGEWVKNSKPRIKILTKMIPFAENVLTNNHVFDIVENNLGHLWISTYGGGLQYFNPNRKVHPYKRYQ